MKYVISLLFLCATLIPFQYIQAQENNTLENSVLWKIEHINMEKPSYLLGTLHMMCSEDFEILDKVNLALQNTDALVLEVNLFDPKEVKAMQNSMLNSKKISEELSSLQFSELDGLVQKVLQMPLTTLDNYGLSTVYSAMFSKMLPCTDLKSMEAELVQLANKKGTPIKSLETVTAQMDFLKKAFPTDFMFTQIMLYESYQKDFIKAITFYKREDITSAVSLLTKADYMNENASKYMQTIRNKNWISKMPRIMEEGSVLFAVGSAHLTGKDGLIYLLRQKGYQVTPIFNKS